MASKSIPQSHKTTKHTTGNTSNQYHHCHTFIGIEISPERAQEARANILQGQTSGLIPSHVTMEIRCENALELNYDEATVVFLYLVPRGLRLIQPILWGGERDVDSKHELMSTNNETVEQTNHGTSEIPQEQTRIPKRIISYMNPIENKTFIKREYCKVGNVEGAAFPIYLYHSW